MKLNEVKSTINRAKMFSDTSTFFLIGSRWVSLRFLDPTQTNNLKLLSYPKYQADNKQKLQSVKVFLKT